MKKGHLATLAVMLVCAVCTMGACGDQGRNGGDQSRNAPAGSMAMSPDMQAFYNSLSSESKRKFDELDPASRQKAVDMGGDPNKAVDSQYGMMKSQKRDMKTSQK